MTQRTVAILAAVLALLVVLILISQRSEQGAGPQPAVLLPGLSDNLDDVAAVTITAGGGEVVATLQRVDSAWVVAERNNYPADVAKLRAGLLALAQARRVEQKTANPQLYDRLGVEPVDDAQANGLLVSIQGLAEPIQVIVGDAAGSDYRYVRLADEATSWLIDRDPALPRATGEWLAPDLLDVESQRVQSITVTHPDSEQVRVMKADRDQTDFTVEEIPAGRELLYAGVANAMGEVLEQLALEDVEESATDAGAPAIISEFRTFDGLVVTATALDRGDSAWVSFAARYDGDQAGDDAAAEDADGTDAQDAAKASERDVAAEAAQLNQRLSGWRYKIARFKFDQMTRTMSDLLQAPAEDDA